MSADEAGIAATLIAQGFRVPLETPDKFVSGPLAWRWKTAGGTWVAGKEVRLHQFGTGVPTVAASDASGGTPKGVAQIFSGSANQPLNCKIQLQALAIDVLVGGSPTPTELSNLHEWIASSFVRVKKGKVEEYFDLAPYIRVRGAFGESQAVAAAGVSVGAVAEPAQKMYQDMVLDFSDGDEFSIASDTGLTATGAVYTFVTNISAAAYDKDANITWRTPTALEARLNTESPGVPGDF